MKVFEHPDLRIVAFGVRCGPYIVIRVSLRRSIVASFNGHAGQVATFSTDRITYDHRTAAEVAARRNVVSVSLA